MTDHQTGPGSYQGHHDYKDIAGLTSRPPLDTDNKSVSSFATFSTQSTADYRDLDLEYETFNGSVSDFADLPPPEEPKQAADDSVPEITPDTTAETYNSVGDLSAETTAEAPDAQYIEMPQLAIAKQREKSVKDFSKIDAYRRISSTVTVKKATSPTTETGPNKFNKLNRTMDKLSDKIDKIDREINVLNELIPDTFDGSEVSQTSDYKKLSYAREKLEERSQELKKQRYELSIRVNRKFRNTYGYNAAESYWITGLGL